MINDDDIVGVVVVDFKKAFDLVDHNLLINSSITDSLMKQ